MTREELEQLYEEQRSKVEQRKVLLFSYEKIYKIVNHLFDGRVHFDCDMGQICLYSGDWEDETDYCKILSEYVGKQYGVKVCNWIAIDGDQDFSPTNQTLDIMAICEEV